MPVGRRWAGRAFGTNIGNLYLTLEGDDAALRGKFHFSDEKYGIAVYKITGAFDGSRIAITGTPETAPEGTRLGDLTAAGDMNTKGEFRGEWSTTIGSAGTFVLFPHDQKDDAVTDGPKPPEQLHTARHDFGALSLTAAQLISIADEIQKDFKSRVIVTTFVDTEQTRPLEEFKKLRFTTGHAKVAKLFVQEHDPAGLNRTVVVEFGQASNFATTQGVDEAWVLGELERLKKSIRPFERFYASSYKKYGIGFNQLLFVIALIYLPSLPGFLSRLVLMVGVIALIYLINRIHAALIPYTAIYLAERSPGFITRYGPSILSAVLSLISALAAALLGGFLQGWLGIKI